MVTGRRHRLRLVQSYDALSCRPAPPASRPAAHCLTPSGKVRNDALREMLTQAAAAVK
jgi:hypothetical protein